MIHLTYALGKVSMMKQVRKILNKNCCEGLNPVFFLYFCTKSTYMYFLGNLAHTNTNIQLNLYWAKIWCILLENQSQSLFQSLLVQLSWKEIPLSWNVIHKLPIFSHQNENNKGPEFRGTGNWSAKGTECPVKGTPSRMRDGNGVDHYSWSKCTNEEFEEFLRSPAGACLR